MGAVIKSGGGISSIFTSLASNSIPDSCMIYLFKSSHEQSILRLFTRRVNRLGAARITFVSRIPTTERMMCLDLVGLFAVTVLC